MQWSFNAYHTPFQFCFRFCPLTLRMYVYSRDQLRSVPATFPPGLNQYSTGTDNQLLPGDQDCITFQINPIISPVGLLVNAYIGALLVLYWCSTGALLVLYWSSIGPLFKFDHYCCWLAVRTSWVGNRRCFRRLLYSILYSQCSCPAQCQRKHKQKCDGLKYTVTKPSSSNWKHRVCKELFFHIKRLFVKDLCFA